MFRNYVKIAFRNLWRRGAYSVLTVAGLSIGMASAIVIFLAVRHDLSFDRFHEHADRIYRVVTIDEAFGVSSQRVGLTIPALAPVAAETFPEIESAVRLEGGGRELFSVETIDHYVDNVFYAESSLFRVFDFELLKGRSDLVLSEPGSVVLTESVALRLFGQEDPVNQTVRHNHETDLIVTGVVADPPPNSHLVYGAFISIFPGEGQEGWAQWLESWTGIGTIVYLMLNRPEDAALLEPKLNQMLRDRDVASAWSVTLQPLTAVHLRSTDVVFDGYATKGNIGYVWGLGLVGVFLLLIAAFNFMNISTARSADRAREVGVRKVSGARHTQLVMQHLGESLVAGMVSFALAMILVLLVLPVLSSMFEREMGLHQLSDPFVIAGLVVLALFVSLLAGSYPAFVLSRFEPSVVLKGSFKRSARGEVLRKGLVIAQFTASVVMIVGTLVVSAQLRHIMERNVGYEREEIVVLSLSAPELTAQAPVLREEILRNPGVRGVARSNSLPGRGIGRIGIVPEGTSEEDLWITSVLSIDENWIDILGVQLAEGRNFSPDFGTDQQSAVILNEAAAREIGWGDPIGKRITATGQDRQVVGVVKDFHFASIRHQVEPLVMLYNPNGGSQMSIRLAAADVRQTLADIEQTWTSLFPGYPFEYSFLSDEFAQIYREETHFAALSRLFAMLAIFIACLGLFGLAAFTAEQRTKEIGVRKVMGATVGSIVALLSKDFAKLVIIGTLIAAPIAYFAMDRWLEDFAYRIEISWWIFLLAGGVALLVALLTVSSQAVRAAVRNPVDSLRYE